MPVLALALSLTGCAALAPEPGPELPPGKPAPETRDEEPTAPTRSAAVVALADRADRAFRAGRFGEAAAILERALGIDGRDAEAWLALGWVRLAQGDSDQARVLANRARALGGEPSLRCRAEHLAVSRVSGGAAIETRDRAHRECGPERG